MDILDRITKSAAQAIDRAKFEALKFQKTSQIQGDLNEIKRQLDAKMIELGQRAYDLYRANQIQSPSVREMVEAIDALRASVVLKEEELREAQIQNYTVPAGAANDQSQAQSVPIWDEPTSGDQSPASGYTPPPASSYAPPTPPASETPVAKRQCPTCSFMMPTTAVFCPNCGFRVGP
ncbi:MAG: zinc ribbon domain-containing protein [Chloroflexaceae bacterium]|nr:zinc ribbon domain-containing protein [Chloroflexaceae bacterium]